ncbi:ATP-grasp domain-containing protein [Actinomadura bangladeshensis]|uniref:ATP-grasp domain-containing protein n=1 Tax=Actinomadura bangladeshensis TaxID=453573 RepID=A0A4R4NLC4_9ACTN|nr:ATP-grasp domain-containing protein [Actinomadura bangladeshensis]TDC08367.1 ATP-grasp domain-containing protein [Actinomadura bangladeshensis]
MREDRAPARDAVLLVDPVLTGLPFKAACRARGHTVVSLYTLSAEALREFAPDHASGDDVTLYAADPARACALVAGTGRRIRAVVPATEPAVHVADVLASRLGLPGNDPATALARRDKSVMRRLAVRAGIAVPEFERVSRPADARTAARRIGFPLVLKPATGAASRGVRLVPHPQDLDAAVAAAADLDLFGAPVRDWLVERYVRGREFAVNAFSLDGRHRIIDVWEYLQPSGADYDQPYWDLIQVPRDDPAHGTAAAFALRVLDAFGIRVGPSHTEVKGDERGVSLMEVASRLPGARIADHWIGHAAFHPFDAALAALLGEADADPEPGFDAVLGICCLRNDGDGGTLRAVHGLDDLAGTPGVDAVHLAYAIGDHVPPTRDLNTIVAKVLVSGNDHTSVRNTLEAVRAKAELEIG